MRCTISMDSRAALNEDCKQTDSIGQRGQNCPRTAGTNPDVVPYHPGDTVPLGPRLDLESHFYHQLFLGCFLDKKLLHESLSQGLDSPATDRPIVSVQPSESRKPGIEGAHNENQELKHLERSSGAFTQSLPRSNGSSCFYLRGVGAQIRGKEETLRWRSSPERGK